MARGDWLDFYLVKDELTLHTTEEVDEAEAVLGLRLPDGYRELVTTLGDGVISGLLRVCRPADLPRRQGFLAEVLHRGWFYDEPDETMSRTNAMESVMVADTLDGDVIIFHPDTRQLHVLPRHDTRTHAVGSNLWALVDWLQDSGVIVNPHPFRHFESFVGPTEGANGNGTGIDVDRVAEAITALGVHDAMEHADSEFTFFVRAIGGYISVYDVNGSEMGAHLRYQTDRGHDVRASLQRAVEAAGVTFGDPWSMAP
ncbi:hypothetical protein N865_05630 [Intrasporangium oryzae NRRL B-24470]|uniref:Knr4/Smi1-like domain-containing protein n=1 Tax=Intrasporangium oryzae NRRL B-24470 TaxID=1386089 RepID=W9GBN2_9MICO|nr:SMI1/KNR4 family protein [Intrasporangium oryzae]EWT01274.1 hypothetical protein N865_05630 [Intrasporangium oryzae NRRL B-24470]